MVSYRARNAGIKTFDHQEQRSGTEVSTSARGASIAGDSTLHIYELLFIIVVGELLGL